MQTIPLRGTANQSLFVVLGGQNCTIRLESREVGTGILQPGLVSLYAGLDVDDTTVFSGQICRNGVPLKRLDYLPFSGDLVFIDMTGDADPQWEGLGTRWRLLYLTPDEAEAYMRGVLDTGATA